MITRENLVLAWCCGIVVLYHLCPHLEHGLTRFIKGRGLVDGVSPSFMLLSNGLTLTVFDLAGSKVHVLGILVFLLRRFYVMVPARELPYKEIIGR